MDYPDRNSRANSRIGLESGSRWTTRRRIGPWPPLEMKPLGSDFLQEPKMRKPSPVVESVKEEPVAGWPSFGQLVSDLSKTAMEAVGSIFLQFILSREGLTPLKDTLKMPEDEQAQLQSANNTRPL